jgi:hypothetical protein
MALDPRQAETFWPLYREYRNEMARVNDRYVKLLVTYADNYDASRTSSRPRCSASTWTSRRAAVPSGQLRARSASCPQRS